MEERATDFGACVINLESSQSRRHAMEAEFARAGLQWRRVPGMLSTALPEHLRSFFMEASGHPVTSLTPGEIGCFAAHLSIMAQMVAGEVEPLMLVLEDDCALPEGLKGQLHALIRSLPAGWDMVRLCNLPKRAYLPLYGLPSGAAVIRYSVIPNFTGAYLVSLAGARKLLASKPKTLPFDVYLRQSWRHESNVYGVWPPMIRQRHDESCLDDIDATSLATRRGRPKRSNYATIWKRIVWQIGTLGFPAWIACHIIDVADSAIRRVTGRTIIHDAAVWMRGSRYARLSTPTLEHTSGTKA